MSTATVPNTDNKTKTLPPYKVILHNDDVNSAPIVVQKIVEFTPLNLEQAEEKTLEAHTEGQSLLFVTHKERAELVQEQFQSCRPPIQVTVEAN